MGGCAAPACASALLGLLTFAAIGCKLDAHPSASGLVVLVDSELSVPKDIDRLQLQVTQLDQVLRSEDHALVQSDMTLPAELRIAPTGDDRPVLIRLIALKGAIARIERSALVAIPSDQPRLLRLTLNFLCDGTVSREGTSSCGSDRTCRQGSCESALIAPTDLLSYDSSTSAATSDGSGTGSGCFDALGCFTGAQPVELDASHCWFVPPAGTLAERINVGFQLAPGADGVCDASRCWIVLEPGRDPREGWTFDGSHVNLPPAICREQPDSDPVVIAFSDRCGSKSTSATICGPSSAPSANVDAGAPAGPPPAVGDACEGTNTQACGNCGMQTRQCQAGKWSGWSECQDQGACSLASAQACGSGGTQTCSTECQWSACDGQACEGAAIRSCGNCGTQRRICSNGMWSDWSECTGEGECTPGVSQSCGRSGSQSCGGNCSWSSCEDQICSGPALQICGNCGSRTHSCDRRSATWSEWSACTGEGECAPDAARSCGLSGTQICGGNCAWDGACSGQVCSGLPTQPCGNCGVQSRRCDNTSGRWSDWSSCGGQGACAPDQTRSCGAGGSQRCADDCRWDPGCSGQACRGAAARSCGNCGEQTRTCDGSSGRWSDWSNCSDAGSCRPGNTRSCGAGGQQRCGDDCSWQNACTGQSCSGDATRACGNCGAQSRTCDAGSGNWSDWSACGAQGSCQPGSSQSCGGNGEQRCGNDCQWQSCVHSCPPSSTRACGNCGTQASSCDPNTGIVSWSECRGEKTCSPGSTQTCANNRTQTCSTSCEWGNCGCDPTETRACGNCGTQTSRCDPATGNVSWDGCVDEGECKPQNTQACRDGGAQTCSDRCEWNDCCPASTTRSCGNCGEQSSSCDPATGQISWSTCRDEGCAPGSMQACGDGGSQACNARCEWDGCTFSCPASTTRSCGNCGEQSSSCDPATGQISWSDCAGERDCTPDSTRSCGEHQNETCSAECQWIDCRCERGYDSCNDRCVDYQSDSANCSGCNQACASGETCSGGQCVGPDAGIELPP